MTAENMQCHVLHPAEAAISARRKPRVYFMAAKAAVILMKERLVHCPYCNDITRTLVIHRYSNAGKRAGKLKRKVEHCTECNKRRITKK